MENKEKKMEVTQLKIDKVYEQLREATGQYLMASSDYESAEYTYKVKKANTIYGGSVVGKNVQQRDAHLAQLILKESEKLNQCRALKLAAESVFELAKIDVEQIETSLQLMQVHVGMIG